MRENFKPALKFTLRYEGVLSMVRSDPGNWTGGKVGKGVLKGTKYGIAAHAHPNLDIKNLTVDQAGEIYRAKYWVVAECDRLAAGVDGATFDYAVNSGPGAALLYQVNEISAVDPTWTAALLDGSVTGGIGRGHWASRVGAGPKSGHTETATFSSGLGGHLMMNAAVWA